MYIAICDDEEAQRLLLENGCRKWADLHGETVQIASFASAEAFLFVYETDKSFDVLLLDIQMPGLSGMELARALRKKRDSLTLALITATSEYALEGYQVDALAYLVKPVSDDSLFAVLDKAESRNPKPFLLIDHDGMTERILLTDIVYLESQGHNTRVVCRNVEYSSPHLLNWYETALNEAATEGHPPMFHRMHRSYLINLSHVSSIRRKDVIMDNEDVLPVARGRFDLLNQAFLAYYRRIL